MLRSVQVAKKQGLMIIPMPANNQTSKQTSLHSFDLLEGGEQWNWLIHELVRMVSHWIAGKGSFSVK
jgi:hypothetical protein